MSPRKIVQKYIQGRLFDDPEVVVVRTKPKRYDDYTQGARDMFLKFMSVEDHERETIKHLPRVQMEAFINACLNDDKFLYKFLTGEKVTFDIEKNEDGNITSITPVTHKRKGLSPAAEEVINSCIYFDVDGIEKTLRLNRAYIVNELREYFGEFSYGRLCPAIRNFIDKRYEQNNTI